jgi:hypothetical protein
MPFQYTVLERMLIVKTTILGIAQALKKMIAFS